jgi:hypothetical protein
MFEEYSVRDFLEALKKKLRDALQERMIAICRSKK